jgi:hypothetical protein
LFLCQNNHKTAENLDIQHKAFLSINYLRVSCWPLTLLSEYFSVYFLQNR